jgi:hypothetical protein
VQVRHKVDQWQRGGSLEGASLPDGARIRRHYRGEAGIARRLAWVEWGSGWSWGRRSGEGFASGRVLPNSEMKLTRLAGGEGR